MAELERCGVTLLGFRQMLPVEVPRGKLRLALAHIQREQLLDCGDAPAASSWTPAVGTAA